MKLYHYNTKRLNEVKSRAALDMDKPDNATDGDEGDPFNYVKSTSWFMEPIPKDLPAILHNKHEFWRPGKVLYEHVINLDDLPSDVYYHLVESHERARFVDKQPWDRVSKDRGTLRTKLMSELTDFEVESGRRGRGRENLRNIIQKTPHDIRKDYRALFDSWLTDPERGKMQRYASGVPHVMLYVDQYIIPVRKVNKITLTGQKTSLESFDNISLRL